MAGSSSASRALPALVVLRLALWLAPGLRGTSTSAFFANAELFHTTLHTTDSWAYGGRFVMRGSAAGADTAGASVPRIDYAVEYPVGTRPYLAVYFAPGGGWRRTLGAPASCSSRLQGCPPPLWFTQANGTRACARGSGAPSEPDGLPPPGFEPSRQNSNHPQSVVQSTATDGFFQEMMNTVCPCSTRNLTSEFSGLRSRM